MHETRVRTLLCGAVVLASVLAWGEQALAEWDYRDGFGVSSRRGELRLNLYLQPRYEYATDDGTGSSLSNFSFNLAGGRLRVWSRNREFFGQVSGGLSGSEGKLLDSFVELGFGRRRRVGLRFGYFHVPFDEQTTHAPFWLRMPDRSIDVAALGHEYDMGIALRGRHIDNGLVWGLSMTNGESDLLENSNVDFLYSFRFALRFGRLFDWDEEVDLVVGVGTSWNLEPWEPVPDEQVNRSVFNETLDVTLQLGRLSFSTAALYRYIDPGAYETELAEEEAFAHVLGWHFELGFAFNEALELAGRVAHLLYGLETQDGAGLANQFQEVEVGTAINGFGHQGRLRAQLAYIYVVRFDDERTNFDTHRVVVQLQAYY